MNTNNNFISKEKNFISVVIYIYNNENNIIDFLRKIDNFFLNKFENHEIILVNDASTDNTLNKIKNNSIFFKSNVSIINMAWTHGSELALLAGQDLAIGDFIFEIESPNNDWPIEIIDQLYEKCLTGFDIVSAIPKRGQKFLSKLFYNLFSKISKLKIDLSTETIHIISRRALNTILMSKEKVRYRKLIYKLTGLPSNNIFYDPISETKQIHRTFSTNLNLGLDILTKYSDFGLQFALIMSFMFFLISLLGGLFAIGSYLFLDTIVSGWTTIMLLLSSSFSGLFLILAIFAKYMSNILIETQDKPAYKISGTERIPAKNQ